MKPNIGGVYGQVRALKSHAEGLYGQPNPDRREVESLLTEYEDARSGFNRIPYQERFGVNLNDIKTLPVDSSTNKAILLRIIIECEKGMGTLGNMLSPVPTAELDKLQDLRKELEGLSAELKDINYEKNVSQAIDEYVEGHTLASALISSRVIIYALDEIPPTKKIEDKVKLLEEKKMIDKEGKDPGEFFLKANKKARNFFSHDIKAFPDPSDALSLLGDSIAILRIICKLEEASKSQDR